MILSFVLFEDEKGQARLERRDEKDLENAATRGALTEMFRVARRSPYR
jgi:hypothetical protein